MNGLVTLGHIVVLFCLERGFKSTGDAKKMKRKRCFLLFISLEKFFCLFFRLSRIPFGLECPFYERVVCILEKNDPRLQRAFLFEFLLAVPDGSFFRAHHFLD